MKILKIFPAVIILGAALNCSITGPSVPVKPVNGDSTVLLDGNHVISRMSGFFFGFNYWMWQKSFGANIAGTESRCSNLNVRILRAGGIHNDFEWPDPLDDGMLSNFGAYCKNTGAVPMLQLPVLSSPDLPARIVRCSNIIISFKKYYPGLKYVSIGNEPDIYDDMARYPSNYYVPPTSILNFTVQDEISNFNAIAGMIRSSFPDLVIIGLELGGTIPDLQGGINWIRPFVSKTGPLLDMLSVHRYPIWPASSSTYSRAKAEYDASVSFFNNLENSISSASGGRNIPAIIGEFNICVDNNPARGFFDATPGTFNSGLWLADFIGAASSHSNIFSIMPWSLAETYTTSFLYADKTPKTNYYAYEMFSRYAYGTMILQKKLGGDLRIFAYKNDAGNVSIFIVNWNKTASAGLNFQATNILDNQSFSYTVPPWSLTCLRLEAGNPVRTSYILRNNGPLPWEESAWQ